MKRLITSMLIVLLISVAFIGSFYKGYYSYAEDINYMSDAELEAAYQAYLQSKGGGFIGNAGARLAYTNGKMLNFLTSEYNTTPFKNINQLKGLLSWEKSELESGNSSVLQLTMRHPEVFSLYTQWLLQNHYFGNGVTDSDGIFDSGIDNNLYSGELFTDADGNTCLVWISSSLAFNYIVYPSSNIQARGTFYKYTTQQIIENCSASTNTFNFNFANGSKSTNIYYWSDINKYSGNNTKSYTNGQLISFSNSTVGIAKGYFIIAKTPTDNSESPYVLCIYSSTSNNKESIYSKASSISTYNSDGSTTINSVNVNFYTNTNNNIINYPTIDADGTLYIRPKLKINGEYKPYIVNEGDSITNVVNNYYNDSGEKDKTITVPSNTPDSGSGGSGGSGGTLPNWNNPYPNLSPDGDGGFNFNFSLPDLNIDWNINGLSEKFPFSIPFDLIRFITVLNAEPETPHFEGTVNLIVYQWDIDADLSQFDNLASIVRNVEFIGFCITLILITRKMIKG